MEDYNSLKEIIRAEINRQERKSKELGARITISECRLEEQEGTIENISKRLEKLEKENGRWKNEILRLRQKEKEQEEEKEARKKEEKEKERIQMEERREREDFIRKIMSKLNKVELMVKEKEKEKETLQTEGERKAEDEEEWKERAIIVKKGPKWEEVEVGAWIQVKARSKEWRIGLTDREWMQVIFKEKSTAQAMLRERDSHYREGFYRVDEWLSESEREGRYRLFKFLEEESEKAIKKGAGVRAKKESKRVFLNGSWYRWDDKNKKVIIEKEEEKKEKAQSSKDENGKKEDKEAKEEERNEEK